MSETKRAVYQMNPAEDYVAFGDELAEGMWVMPQDLNARNRPWPDEDEFLRGQRFCRVTKLRHDSHMTAFVGEWVDGYQFAYRLSNLHSWIVKRDQPAGSETPAKEA